MTLRTAGSAADTQHIAGLVKNKFLSRRMLLGRESPSVSQVAHYVKYLLRKNVNSNDGGEKFQASLICAGVDGNGNGGGPRIFAIAPGGSLYEEEHFCVSGSGSTLLLGMLDQTVKEGLKLSKKEAIELVEKLLKLSIARDGSSGGLIRMVVMTTASTDDQENGGGGMEHRTVYPKMLGSGNDNDTSSTEATALEGFAPPQRR
ncbi:MAG: hypothetical protein SGARI_005606 [Bacillariaceae sp.]